MPNVRNDRRDVFGQIWDSPALSSLPALALAYVGDAVYELYVRISLAEGGLTRTNSLHKQAVARVKAQAQADILRTLWPVLMQDELSVAKRGRNSKGGGVPKGATVAEYRLATGFEALVGYLFLSGRESRLGELLEIARSGAMEATAAVVECDKELTKA